MFMGCNSIRTNISKSDVISDIRLTKAADTKEESVFLVVEGIDDIQFFQNKITDNVYLYESYSGKSGTQDIVKHFMDNKIVGVCDKDYDRECDCDYIFFYDYTCLEMMIISSIKTFKSTMSSLCKIEADAADIRDILLRRIKLISIFRKLNHQYSWGLRVTGLRIQNCFDESLLIIEDRLLTEIMRINIDKSSVPFEEIRTLLYKMNVELDIEEIMNLTNGHDFIHCIHSWYQKRKIKKQSEISADKILTCLFCSYSDEEFHKTLLYRSIKSYEILNSLIILKV